ncbi:MAG: oligosaccharide flippase family protein [Solirubrobacteraceae bacterium]
MSAPETPRSRLPAVIWRRSIGTLRGLLAKGVRRDAAWLLGAQCVALVVTFVATPIELHRMGSERYGIFVVLSAAAGFASLFDLGAGYTVMRFVPWHHAKRDLVAGRRVVVSALLLCLIIGGSFAAVLLCLARPLTLILDLSPAARPDTVDAIRITAAFIPIMLVSAVLSGLARAVGMFALSGILSAGQVIALNAAWIAVAGRQHDIVLLAVAQVGIGCAVIGVGAVTIKVRHGWALGMARPRRSSIGEILSFGTKTSVAQGALGVLTTADKPLLGALLPLSVLPVYSIPFAFASRITMVPSSLSSAIFPPVVEALASGAGDELVRLRRRAFAVVGLLSGLLAVNCVFGGKPLLALWVGTGFAREAWPALAVLGVGFGVMACGFVGNVLLDAVGQPGVVARLMTAGAVSGLALAAAGAAVFKTPVAASGGTAAGLLIIGLGGVELARRLEVPVSRGEAARSVFEAWVPLTLAAGASRLGCDVAGAGSAVTLAVVVCATTVTAALVAFRPGGSAVRSHPGSSVVVRPESPGT